MHLPPVYQKFGPTSKTSLHSTRRDLERRLSNPKEANSSYFKSVSEFSLRNTAVSHRSIVVGDIVGEINRPNFCFRRPPSLLLRHCHTHWNTCRRVLSTSSPHKLLCDKLRQKCALLCTRRFIRETVTSAQRAACSRLASEQSRRRQDEKL